jgi:hypothetical protein
VLYCANISGKKVACSFFLFCGVEMCKHLEYLFSCLMNTSLF